MVETVIKKRKRCKKCSTKIRKRCSTSESELRDWAHLPELALHLISTKVKSITDYVRFRAVCSSWRCASPPKPSHLPPQLPWLMIDDRRTTSKSTGLFYDLWESKMRKLYFPGTICPPCIASCRGWLFLSSRRGGRVFLLNPLTWTRIRLPSLFSNEFNHRYVSKVIFSTDPTDPNCLIMVLYCVKRMIHFCRVQDPCWTDVVTDQFSVIYDATYYNGRFYLLCEGYMEIVESNKPEERIVYYFKPKIRYVSKRFLEGKSGVYVVAFPLNIYEKDKALKKKIELYQFQEQSLKLKQIASTNDTAIFKGWDGFFLSVCSDDRDLVDYIGGNYINVCKSWTEPCYHICSTKLDNGKSDVVCDLDEGHHIELLTWFQPSFV